jgi:hypothetical protein
MQSVARWAQDRAPILGTFAILLAAVFLLIIISVLRA